MKRVFEWHGDTYYYLGTAADGTNYFYQKAKFDCDWYWGIGYVESFTNNSYPWRARDIDCHTHFDYMMDQQTHPGGTHANWFYGFKNIFHETLLTDSEIWKVCEIMRSLYTARNYSDMLYRGGSYYTSNPVAETIKNTAEYGRINKVVIPALLENLYKILDGTSRKGEEEAK